MFWILVVGGSIIGIIILVVVVGLLLPKNHHASVSRALACSPIAVWNIIIDVSNIARWRHEIKDVTKLPDRNGKPAWREVDKSGQAITYETLELVPGQRIVRRIADEGLPFGGTWTIDIKPHTGGTTNVTITEDGVVFNPIFRFVSKFILGHTRTMETYLQDLDSCLRASPEPLSSSNSKTRS